MEKTATDVKLNEAANKVDATNSEAKPAEKKADSKPAKTSTDKKVEEKKTEEKPKAEAKKTEKKSEEKPATKTVEEKKLEPAAEKKVEEKPKTAAQNADTVEVPAAITTEFEVKPEKSGVEDTKHSPEVIQLKRSVRTFRGPSVELVNRPFSGGRIEVIDTISNFYKVRFVRAGFGLVTAYMLCEEVARCRY